MKKLLLATLAAMLLMSPFMALANELTFDPTLPDQRVLTVNCGYPVARTDGTPLAIDEIAKVTFYVKNKGEPDEAYVLVGENTTECKKVFDMTKEADGSYTYAVKTWDTEARIGDYSTEVVNAIVKRVAPPGVNPGVTGLRS